MNTFILSIADGAGEYRFDDVVSFVGEDASGSFGLQARHERLLTILEFGMARYRTADGAWHYLAMPGGVLRFAGNRLTICTRRCVPGEDYRQLEEVLNRTLAGEEQELSGMRDRLRRLEEGLLQRVRDWPRVARS